MSEFESGVCRVQLFGKLATPVRFRTQKTAQLLAYLALHPDKRFSRDSLAGLFWADSGADTARQSLRMAVSNIRQVLSAEAVGGDSTEIFINPSLVTTDVDSFRENVRIGAFREALDLVSGPLFEGIFEQWAEDERQAMAEEIAIAAGKAMEVCAEERDFETGILIGKRVLAMLDCREDLHLRLMQLYVAGGTPSLAVAQFEELEKALDETYGERPSKAAVDLLESIPRAKRAKQSGLEDQFGLFGRESLLKAIIHQLQSDTLVSLVGPGGCGKTSLAQAVRDISKEGVCFVELASETTTEGLGRQIQSALGLPIGDAKEAPVAIGKALSESPKLLILDNFEQLIPLGPAWIERLRAATPESKILVTTQIELGCDGERAVPVGPLSLPPGEAGPKELEAAPASALFLREATRANPNFKATPENSTTIAELCQHLDGLPLALTLAGARAFSSSPHEILSRITDSVKFLKRRNPDPNVKHSSLTETIRWTFELLSEPAQAAALKLGVFSGSFDRETAERILGEDFEEAIDELIEVNLLNSETHQAGARFWMFETVRGFLQQESRDQNHHEANMLNLLNSMIATLESIELDASLSALQRTRKVISFWDNSYRALAYCVDNDLAYKNCTEMCVLLGDAASTFGHSLALAESCRKLYDREAGDDRMTAMLGEMWTRHSGNVGDVHEQWAVLERIDPLAQGDVEILRKVRFRQSIILKAIGRYQEGLEKLDYVLENTPESDHTTRAHTIYNQGLLVCCLADHAKSLELNLKALPEARRGNDPQLLVRVLYDCGSELANHKRFEESLVCFEEALELCEKIGSIKLEGLTRWQKGDALLRMGRFEEALASLQISIRRVIDADFIAGLKWIFLNVSEALVQTGHVTLGIKVLAKMVYVREAESRILADYEKNNMDNIITAMMQKVSKPEFDRYWAEGAASEWMELVDSVLAL